MEPEPFWEISEDFHNITLLPPGDNVMNSNLPHYPKYANLKKCNEIIYL
jgi:hypothetical protein